MRSNEREQLKREIKSVTESAVEGGADGNNHVSVSVQVNGAVAERPIGYAYPVRTSKAKRSKKSVRKRLNPNLVVDRLFRLVVIGLLFAWFAYMMSLGF